MKFHNSADVGAARHTPRHTPLSCYAFVTFLRRVCDVRLLPCQHLNPVRVGANRPLVARCVLRNETEHAPRNTYTIGLFRSMSTNALCLKGE